MQHAAANPLVQTLEGALAPHRRAMERAYALVVAFMAVTVLWFFLVNDALTFEGLLGATMVIAAGLFPGWLWLRGYVQGLPVVPVIGVVDIFWFALPILSQHPSMDVYSPGAVLRAAGTETLFLLSITAAWWFVGRRGPLHTPTLRMLSPTRAGFDRLVFYTLLGLAAGTLYTVLDAAGVTHRLLRPFPRGTAMLLTVGFSVLSLLCLFFLAYSHGARMLRTGARTLFFVLTAMQVLGMATSLLLYGTTALLLAAAAGYTIGRGRVPWRFLVGVVALLALLHAGKTEMRERYWTLYGGTGEQVSLERYPAFYHEWFQASVARVTADDSSDGRQESGAQSTSLLERVSLIQMLLLAQEEAPARVPHLKGETYTVIPALFVPRVIWPEKPRTHRGQEILNIRFGLQTEEETGRTFIEWGLAAEAWANFGFAGIVGVGALIGLFLGWIARLSTGVPMGSLRFLSAMLIFLNSLHMTALAASLWTTIVFQSFAILAVAALLFMQTYRRTPEGDELAASAPKAVAAQTNA